MLIKGAPGMWSYNPPGWWKPTYICIFKTMLTDDLLLTGINWDYGMYK